MAEIEFSVLSRSCLKQRVPNEPALRREVQALVTERNAARATINWRFNTQDARGKLHRLYPFGVTGSIGRGRKSGRAAGMAGQGRPSRQSAPEQAERQAWRVLVMVLKAKLEAVEAGITTITLLQRRFLNLVSFWAEPASRKARPQSCQACGQVAMKRCSRSLYCEPSL